MKKEKNIDVTNEKFHKRFQMKTQLAAESVERMVNGTL